MAVLIARFPYSASRRYSATIRAFLRVIDLHDGIALISAIRSQGLIPISGRIRNIIDAMRPWILVAALLFGTAKSAGRSEEVTSGNSARLLKPRILAACG